MEPPLGRHRRARLLASGFALGALAACAVAPPATDDAPRKASMAAKPGKPKASATPAGDRPVGQPDVLASQAPAASASPAPAASAGTDVLASPTAGVPTLPPLPAFPSFPPPASAAPSGLPSAAASPLGLAALATRVADRLGLVARINFTSGRAEVIANNGGGVLANNGGGLIANNGGGLIANNGGGLIANNGGVIANNGSGYRLTQAAPAISTSPEPDETLGVRRRWDAGGGLLGFSRPTSAQDNYYRRVTLAPGGAPVLDYLEITEEKYGDGKTKTFSNRKIEADEAGTLRLTLRTRHTLDANGRIQAVRFEPNTAKIRFPEKGVSLDIDEFEIDSATGLGRFAYKQATTGTTETGTLTQVKHDAEGKLWYSWGDPLGYYAGGSTVRDAQGAFVVGKTRELAADGTVTRSYDLGDGLVLKLTRGARNLFSGPLEDHGQAVGQAALKIFGDGTTIFEVTFTERPDAPLRVGWGNDPEAASPVPSAAPTPRPAWQVTTVAGATAGFADGPGASARFGGLGAIVASRTTADRWYLADAAGHRVRVLTRAGDAWTVGTHAGTGTAGGDDGAAAQATFAGPYGLAIAADDTLYVAEADGNRIRRIGPDGAVTTLAGAAEAGFLDATGTAARFDGPAGLALAGDTLYVADRDNHRIRAVALPTGAVSTVAGTGAPGEANGPGLSATLRAPLGLAIGDDGALYAAEPGNRLVRRIDVGSAGAPVTTFAGQNSAAVNFFDGPAAEAGIYQPSFVTPDGAGGLYSGRMAVRGVGADRAIRTIAGQSFPGSKDGAHDEATFSAIGGLVRLPDGALLATDGPRVRLLRPPTR